MAKCEIEYVQNVVVVNCLKQKYVVDNKIGIYCASVCIYLRFVKTKCLWIWFRGMNSTVSMYEIAPEYSFK